VLDEQQKRLFDDVIVCVDRIKLLVRNVLDFAKPSPPEFKRGRIEHVLNHCISLLDSQMKKKKIRVSLSLEPDTPEIMYDYRQFEQVFINLLLNAMEAIQGGGKIDIQTKEQKDNLGDSCLIVTIQDTGVGIEKENLAEIFNPFFTTKADGTGLGLSIVHKILEQHDSSIEVASIPFEGTKVTLKFPTSDMKRKYVQL
jgi:signal transduction histidine kinase